MTFSIGFGRFVKFANSIRSEEALASYDKALAIQPDDHQTWYNRGNALGNLGRYKEALASYDKALAIQPDDQQSWYTKACTYALQGKIDPALENLQKAIILNEKYRNLAKEDVYLASIRHDSRFQKLMQEEIIK